MKVFTYILLGLLAITTGYFGFIYILDLASPQSPMEAQKTADKFSGDI